MVSKKMQDAINSQINAELYSENLYLSMSAYFEDLSLAGFAHWMRVQAQEERIHAMKFFDYVNERGGRVTVSAVKAPPKTWKSPLTAFEEALKHEKKVTSLINNLVDLEIKEKDHASNSFLAWYVDEQVEEEATADEIVSKLKLMKDAPGGLFMVDQELGARAPKWPLSFNGVAGEKA